MWDAAKLVVATMAAFKLNGVLRSGRKQKEPGLLMKALGHLFLAGFAGFGAYNLYTCIASGVVFRFARRRSSGWIAYADDPLAFLVWTGVYSLPLVVVTLMIFGHFSRIKQGNRAAFRQFTEGSGLPDITRPWRSPDR